MDLDAVMAGLSLNKDNLSYDSILRLQQLLAEGMKLHDPAQAESMREMLKKMRVSPEQKPSFQFTSPKPPAQAAPDTARGRPVNGATWSPSPLDANAEKEVERQLFGEASPPALQGVSRWEHRPRNRPQRTSATNACRRDRPSPKPQSRSRPLPSTSARRRNREPLELWISSRPWTLRRCPPVHLILARRRPHENHRAGRRAGPNQDKTLLSCSKRPSPRTRLRWRPRRLRAQVRAGAFLVGEEEEQAAAHQET